MSADPSTLSAVPTVLVPDLEDPALYINRELSWLQFNARVLDEALDTAQPLLERVKFLAIFAKNLDEFFMIRVSGLRRQVLARVVTTPADGMSPPDQLAAIRTTLDEQLARLETCWHQDLLPQLQSAGLRVCAASALTPAQNQWLRQMFRREIFPQLTPLAFDPTHPFPHMANLSLNLAVVVHTPEHGERFARVKIPDMLPRLLRLPADTQAEGQPSCTSQTAPGSTFVWLETVIAANLDLLFPDVPIIGSYPFRITRDTDLEIREDESADLLTALEEQIDERDFGSAIRLEVTEDAPEPIRTVLMRNLRLEPADVYTSREPLGFADLMGLATLEYPACQDRPFVPALPRPLQQRQSLFEAIRQHDMLLYHPYDSFLPVVEFLREAARDPQVVAIKQTLYRTGSRSPIVEALLEARQEGKQVAVLVELKARFDEESNIAWARALEDEGVHVAYGVLGLKTHAKLCLVVRREQDGLRYYVHMSTGNYNQATSRVYTDLGYFTCQPAIGEDAADLFNALTGYSRKAAYHRLLVAPHTLRTQLLQRIQREIDRQRQHGDGYLAFKMNALVDPLCIQALYRASQAGVRIDLQVRGICCLRPGIPGVSETITVTSIVGRFLEHARIYYFRNGGQDEVLLGSADLMPRNLDRRVELLFPVDNPRLRDTILHDILQVHLRDNVQARRLLPDGSYERLRPQPGETPLSSQTWLLQHWGQRDNTE
ncbi:MAG: polyphosphate kinase 1 [Candidatus Tectimicrobiota bacterium]